MTAQGCSRLLKAAQGCSRLVKANWKMTDYLTTWLTDHYLFLSLMGFEDHWSKNLFYKRFFICSKGFKINFQNRKWNYPNRKWNYFSHFQASDQKTSFTKCLSFNLRVSKLIQIMKWNTLKCIDFLFVDILSLSLFTSLLHGPPFSIQGHILLKRSFYT